MRRATVRVGFVTLLAVAATTSAVARPEFWELYRTHYRLPVGSDSDRARCMNCHTSPPQHNPYGAYLKQMMKLEGTPSTLSDHVLRISEAQDSDGDGWANGEESRAGTNPGDPTSHPIGSRPRAPAMAPQAMGESPFMPRHTFHPVIVHFPIALFIFGAFLDFLGRYRRDDVVRGVGFWNLLFGLLATLVAIPTGFIAAIRLGYPLSVGTPVFTHLSLGILAALLMLVVVLWRRTNLVTSKAYWILLAIAAAVVGVAGHFGGQMVYG